MEVEFTRICGFKDLFSPGISKNWENQYGIYVWTLPCKQGGKERLEYIGQATKASLLARQVTHIKGFESLHYELSGEHRASKKDWCYGKQNADFICIHGDSQKAEELRKEMLDYAYSLILYFSTDLTNTARADPKKISEIERDLISRYKPFTNKAYKNAPPSSQVKYEPIGDLLMADIIQDQACTYKVESNPNQHLVCNG
ncbi:MAG: hypothetical protein C4575_14165 [Desulforudis sp.]|jgi:hypothetical protein|nr:MAG: hypothetical protein C4575_14165 [Desulforudis sp.]